MGWIFEPDCLKSGSRGGRDQQRDAADGRLPGDSRLASGDCGAADCGICNPWYFWKPAVLCPVCRAAGTRSQETAAGEGQLHACTLCQGDSDLQKHR